MHVQMQKPRMIHRAGQIASALNIVSDPGNPLSVADQQHEGMTMDENGVLYVVSENGGGDINHPQLWVYKPSSVPNEPPFQPKILSASRFRSMMVRLLRPHRPGF